MLVTNVSKGIKNHQSANDTKRHDEITEKKWKKEKLCHCKWMPKNI